MNDDELNEVYSTLVGILDEAGLGWIASQVSEEISTGRLVEKVSARGNTAEFESATRSTVQPVMESVAISQDRPPTRKAMIATEAFGPQERTQVLIRAIKRVISDSHSITEHLAEFLRQESSLSPRSVPTRVMSAHENSAERDELVTVEYSEPESLAVLTRLLDDLNIEVSR